MNSKLQEYIKTDESKKNWSDDISSIDLDGAEDTEPVQTNTTTNKTTNKPSGNIVDDILRSIFFGPAAPAFK